MSDIDDIEGRRRNNLTQACELIAFRMGSQEFCVDIMSVREIRGWTKATVSAEVSWFRARRRQLARHGAAHC